MRIEKTKIIATIGPAVDSEKALEKMMLSGMNVARLNFSHGSHDEHKERIRRIRKVSEALNHPVAILQDLRGPKIRIGPIPEPGMELKPGQTVVLTPGDVSTLNDEIIVTHKHLSRDVKRHDRLLLADGLLELVVESIDGKRIFCKVVIGGLLTSNKGITLPSGSFKVPATTKKDLEDLAFGLAEAIDYVALSFVRSAKDILSIREFIKKKQGHVKTPVIAKIEKHEALDNIDQILAVSDGIMVARGDLGVEIPLENVPGIQKMLVKKANALGKPVIIATQMLRSMVDSPRPTRAEAADVANAVLDGADAVMLSEETAIGNFPVEAVRYMRRITRQTEKYFPHETYLKLIPGTEVSESTAYAACVLADHLEAGAIIATTKTGFTAKQISKFRPKTNILAVSPDAVTVRALSLYWGCIPTLIEKKKTTDAMIATVKKTAIESGIVSSGENIVITAGYPLWVAGTTNIIQVDTV
ncbi:MAG: pyruvate kinase [Desulfobacterales bacterium]